jgi:hypothetical protein
MALVIAFHKPYYHSGEGKFKGKIRPWSGHEDPGGE